MNIPITQAFRNGYHLEKQDDTFIAVKNLKGCCFSKTLTLQTKNERKAIVSLAEQFKETDGKCNPSLYPALNKRYQHIDRMISGFINWIKAIFFRSKAYNQELKLLRQELQNFRALFSRKDVIHSIRNKVHLATEPQCNSSKIFNEIRREFPQAVINKAPKEKDFSRGSFFIEKVSKGYHVYFPPFHANELSHKYFTKNLNNLLDLEEMYRTEQLYTEVAHRHFEESDRFNKGELSFSFSPKTCSMTVSYFLPTQGDCQVTLNLSDFQSKKELEQELDKYKNASSESFQKIQCETITLGREFPEFSIIYSGRKKSFIIKKLNESITFEVPRPFVDQMDLDEFTIQFLEKIRAFQRGQLDFLNAELQKGEEVLHKINRDLDSHEYFYDDEYTYNPTNQKLKKLKEELLPAIREIEKNKNEIEQKISNIDKLINEIRLKKKGQQATQINPVNPEKSIKEIYQISPSVNVKLIFNDLKAGKIDLKKLLLYSHEDKYGLFSQKLKVYGIDSQSTANQVYNLMAVYRKGEDRVLLQLVEELTSKK